MKKYTKLIVFLAILILGFLASILVLSFPLLTGKTFVFQTEPVDPFDIFRGQYLTIGYPMAHLENTSFTNQDIGKDIYISLSVDADGIAQKTAVSSEKPTGDFIKGKIARSWRGLTAELGIEQYFFERGAELSTTNMTVEVKVDSFGNARITRLLYKGKPLEINYTR